MSEGEFVFLVLGLLLGTVIGVASALTTRSKHDDIR